MIGDVRPAHDPVDLARAGGHAVGRLRPRHARLGVDVEQQAAHGRVPEPEGRVQPTVAHEPARRERDATVAARDAVAKLRLLRVGIRAVGAPRRLAVAVRGEQLADGPPQELFVDAQHVLVDEAGALERALAVGVEPVLRRVRARGQVDRPLRVGASRDTADRVVVDAEQRLVDGVEQERIAIRAGGVRELLRAEQRDVHDVLGQSASDQLLGEAAFLLEAGVGDVHFLSGGELAETFARPAPCALVPRVVHDHVATVAPVAPAVVDVAAEPAEQELLPVAGHHPERRDARGAAIGPVRGRARGRDRLLRGGSPPSRAPLDGGVALARPGRGGAFAAGGGRGQGRDRGRLEERFEGDLDVERVEHARDDPRHGERVPAELEEVVVRAHLVHAEHAAPDLRDLTLDVRARRDELGAGVGAQPALRLLDGAKDLLRPRRRLRDPPLQRGIVVDVGASPGLAVARPDRRARARRGVLGRLVAHPGRQLGGQGEQETLLLRFREARRDRAEELERHVVLLGGAIAQVEAAQPARHGDLAELGDHSMLDPATQRATTEQERVHLQRVVATLTEEQGRPPCRSHRSDPTRRRPGTRGLRPRTACGGRPRSGGSWSG